MNIIMPQLGETVTEGTVTKWYKQVGDAVKVDETLFDVETDKVSTEIPSPVAGVIAGRYHRVNWSDIYEIEKRTSPRRHRRACRLRQDGADGEALQGDA